ncbi:S24 family peptidase [Acinetobacter rudis]|uniref:S24 family peptidase n=1 Tax=Acinetobacter rudis TaxID=632955 RepID=UPI00280D7028|nr:S24 family peptidase [Acinetobacter rudis]MDQ8954518.1 S24 family peptidase [Acinetobacter rudis]
MDTSGRINLKMKELGLTQADLIRSTGAGRATVHGWVNGTNKPSAKHINALSNALKTTPQWLLDGHESHGPSHSTTSEINCKPVFAWETPEDLDPNAYVIIPHVNVRFSAGNGCIAEFEPTEKELGTAQPIDWIHKKKISPKNLVTVDIDGDSMEPRIPNGSVVMLDKSINTLDQVQSGRVYAIRYGNELKIKRLSRRFDGALIIDSDNPEYKTEIVELNQLEHISIIGKYVSHSYDGEI